MKSNYLEITTVPKRIIKGESLNITILCDFNIGLNLAAIWKVNNLKNNSNKYNCASPKQ